MASLCFINRGWILELFVLLPLVLGDNSRDICKRDPPGTAASKTPGDNGFRIKIVGRPQPERYTPEQVYTVVINGTYPNQRLLGFMLVAVPLNAKDESTSMGTFQHLSTGATKFAENCPYVVTHTYPNPKAGVEVLWTAPPPSTGCIEFRATVLEYNDIWYKDDGALTVVFCEETGTTENHHSPEMIPDCCACGTAKYQMTFHGTWSHRTHPKQFPQKKRLLHWSNIVGASHSKRYTIWKYGGYATEGVRQVCEFAYTRILEEEMRQHSRDVRTVVKTPGIWWSDPHGLEQTRWARFSVDKKNHLVSMLAMLGPSPDWCVGVSALNLCLPNCTWVGDIEVKLYPWDAGTDDGVTYMSTNKRSSPQQKIHKITNTYPNNPQSPFFGPNPIKSLATLKIRRIHPKIGEQMVCTGQEDFDRFDDDIEDSDDLTISDAERKTQLSLKQGKCAMSEWSDWSMCSVTCGVGQMFRKRTYLNKDVNEDTCGQPTVESENCIGIETECEKPGEECAVARWSDWSPCSVTCGKGTRERQRFYYDPNDEARCNRKLVEIEICTAPILDCSKAISMLNFTAICSQPKDVGRCRADFTRYYYDTAQAKCLPFSYTGCRGNSNNFMTLEECLEMCFPVMQEAVLEQEVTASESSTEVLDRSEEIDITEDKDDLTATEICSLPSVTGPCKARLTRYYFDTTLLTCVPFRYGGCKGNKNNFGTEAQCMDTCFMVMRDEMMRRRLQQNKQLESDVKQQAAEKKAIPQNEAEKMKVHQTTMPQPSKKNKKGKKHKKHKDNKDATTPMANDGGKVDCIVTEWSGWSACSSTCGRGYKYKRRAVKQEAQNGGKKCPRKLEKKKRCKMPKCQKGRHQQEVGVTRAGGQGEGHHQNHVVTRGKRDIDIVVENQRNSTEDVIRNDQIAMKNKGKNITSEDKRKLLIKNHAGKKNERKQKRMQRKKADGLKEKKQRSDAPKKKNTDKANKKKKKRGNTLKRKKESGDKLKRKKADSLKNKKSDSLKKQSKHKHQNKSDKFHHQKKTKIRKQNSKQKLDVKKSSNTSNVSLGGLKGKQTINTVKLDEKHHKNDTTHLVRGKKPQKHDKLSPIKQKIKDKTTKGKRKESKRKNHIKAKNKKKVSSSNIVYNKTKVHNEKESNRTIAFNIITRKENKHHRNNRVSEGNVIKSKQSNNKKPATVAGKDKKDKQSRQRKTRKKNDKQSATSRPRQVVTPAPVDKKFKVRDCVITEWSDWSHCSVTCGRGFQFKRRIIEAVEKNGGKPCPVKLEKRRRCVLDKCSDERCKMSDWGPWTPCPKTCGSGSIQERTRQVIAAPDGDTSLCGARIERRYCTLPPCPSQNGTRKSHNSGSCVYKVLDLSVYERLIKHKHINLGRHHNTYRSP